MSLSPMSHVEFKKVPCRPVDFRGQGPFLYPAALYNRDLGNISGKNTRVISQGSGAGGRLKVEILRGARGWVIYSV